MPQSMCTEDEVPKPECSRKSHRPKKPFATFLLWPVYRLVLPTTAYLWIHIHQKWCLLLTSGHFFMDKLIQFSHFCQFYLSVTHICAMKHSHSQLFGLKLTAQFSIIWWIIHCFWPATCSKTLSLPPLHHFIKFEMNLLQHCKLWRN